MAPVRSDRVLHQPQAEGNALFAAGDLGAATDKYLEALGQVDGALEVPALQRRPDFGDLLRRCNAAHASCHLNLAAVASREGAHESASDHCAEALRVEPKRVKGHFRLAQARPALARLAAACSAVRRRCWPPATRRARWRRRSERQRSMAAARAR